MTAVRHPASLRDPAGYLVKYGKRLLRVIRPEFVCEYRTLLANTWLQQECKGGAVSDFRVLEADEANRIMGFETADCLCIEQKVISFPSFPSEWPLEMLCEASEHTLKICRNGLEYGIGMKDASPFNILFQGPKPVFVDLLSFESRNVRDPIWLALGQFIRTFLLPALLDARYGIPCHSTFLSHNDGIEPEEVYRFLGPLARFTLPFLAYVTMPVLLAAKAERESSKVYAIKRLSNSEQAAFILESRFSRLIRATKAASIRKQQVNTWTKYNETCTYTKLDFEQKSAFVARFLLSAHPAKVLDVGCNTGHFSFLATQAGAEVVAIDHDPEVVACLWKRAKSEQANILPLIVNLARPTPAFGWRNRETPSFLERAEGYFDAVLMMAVLHHLLVTDQIPLREIIEQIFRLTTEWLVIEYVGPGDPQFKRLLRGRDDLYHWFHKNVFEQELRKYFEIIQTEEIVGNGRWLYLARKLNAPEVQFT